MNLNDQKQIKKKKKPAFRRQEAHKKKRLEGGWRKPKGLHSKLREQRKGYGVLVKPGYGTPVALRHHNKEGKQEILVHNLKELKEAPVDAAIIIAAGVGIKSKVAIVEEGQKQKRSFSNLDVAAFTKIVAKMKAERDKKKAAAEEKKKKKAKQIKESELKAAEEKKAEEAKASAESKEDTEDEKKKREKQEKDALLTQKDGGY